MGSTPFYIELLDGAGKKAAGYLGAVGAGETLGIEELLNPSFDIDTSNWTAYNSSIASIVGGQSGKCLEVNQAVNPSLAYQNTASPLIALKLYKQNAYVKSGTSGNEQFDIRVYANGSYLSQLGISSSSWVLYSHYYNLVVGDSFSQCALIKVGATVGTMLFDEANLKRVTDPPSTAVHIVSSLNGTVRNWASVESGFDPNAIASWIIYKTNHNPVIGWYLDGVNDLVSHTSINLGKTHTLLYWIIASANKRQIVHGGAANYHVAIDGTNLYYNAGATELLQAHSGGTGKPLMIGIVRSGATVQFFKNGIQVGTDQTIDANNNQTLNTLGSYDTPGTFLDGVILEDYGFTRAFTATEVKSYYDLTRKVYGV